MTMCFIIRKTSKLAGTAAAIILLAFLVVSIWFPCEWLTPQRDAEGLQRGWCYFANIHYGDEPRHNPEVRRGYHSSGGWWGSYILIGTSVEWLAMPLWPLLTASTVVAAAGWRADLLARRRAAPGFCPTCSYDRAGLAPQAVCPECGAAPAVASSN